MSFPYSPRESAALDMALSQLEADGFEVFLNPSKQLLPNFLDGYRPDAIALKGNKRLFIEVAPRLGAKDSKSWESRTEHLQQLIAEHDDWEFKIFYIPQMTATQKLSSPPRALIKEHMDRVSSAFDVAGPTASLLTAWSVFEAAARSSMPDGLERPQTPAHLLEVLASDGIITPEEADFLRPLGQLRNEAAHGRLDAVFTRSDLDRLLDITQTVLDTEDMPSIPAAL